MHSVIIEDRFVSITEGRVRFGACISFRFISFRFISFHDHILDFVFILFLFSLFSCSCSSFSFIFVFLVTLPVTLPFSTLVW